MTHYISNLMRVVNNTTGNITYYIEKFDHFTRVSESDYNTRKDEAETLSNLQTVTKGSYTRHFTTCNFYH